MTKQDCELKAFYRLAERLKIQFPRLPILLSLDGLFAGGPTFDLCRRYGWKFMIVLKDDDLPSVNEEFDALSKLQPENRLVWRTGKQAQIKQTFRWADDIAYTDSEKKEHTLSVIECLEAKPDKEGQKKTTKFKWVTNGHVSGKNVTTLSNDGGRRSSSLPDNCSSYSDPVPIDGSPPSCSLLGLAPSVSCQEATP